jgi:TatA/E family protein of Tat protein translocase
MATLQVREIGRMAGNWVAQRVVSRRILSPYCATVAVVIALSEVLAATGTPHRSNEVPGERHMNVFGIGPQEMMIIAVLALLVFGPGKLPEVMGQAGKLVRDFRRMSAELSGEFEKTIAEARDATSGLTAELGGMSKEVNSVTNSVKKDLGLKGGTAGSKAKFTTGAKTGTTSKAGSTSKTSTSKTTATGSKTSTAKGTTSSTTTSKATTKASTPVASREDPAADMSLFAPAPVERKSRSRKAVPSIISDPTPRDIPTATEPGMEAEIASVLGGDAQPDDALARSRQRRRNAGYARQSA